MEAGSFTAPDGRRSVLKRPSGARLPDVILQWGVTLLSVAILLLIAYFFLKLIDESTTVFDRFGACEDQRAGASFACRQFSRPQ